jgi:hypothetical protein
MLGVEGLTQPSTALALGQPSPFAYLRPCPALRAALFVDSTLLSPKWGLRAGLALPGKGQRAQGNLATTRMPQEKPSASIEGAARKPHPQPWHWGLL